MRGDIMFRKSESTQKCTNKSGVFCSILESESPVSPKKKAAGCRRHLLGGTFATTEDEKNARGGRRNLLENADLEEEDTPEEDDDKKKKSKCKNSPVRQHEWKSSLQEYPNKFSPIHSGDAVNTKSIIQYTEFIYDRQDLSLEDKEKMERYALQRLLSEKLKTLPKYTGKFVTNHMQVNKARTNCEVLTLYRDTNLDELAAAQAQIMASKKKREHSDADVLVGKILELGPCRICGENVCRGADITEIHQKMITDEKYEAEKQNMLDTRYSRFGIGIAEGSDKKKYLCQIFKG